MISSLSDRLPPAPAPTAEDEPVAAVRAIDVLHTAEEDIYNSIVQAAADVCQTSMACLDFPEGSRRWFKSRAEIALPPMAGEIYRSFPVADMHELLIVTDTLKDPRFRTNLMVTRSPYIRFYAGVTLCSSEGMAVGILAVMDTRPRTLNDRQKIALVALAKSAERVLELRKNVGMAVFARAIDMASDGVTIAGDTGAGMTIMYANKSFERLTGYSYLDAINQLAFFPLRHDCGGLLGALAEAARTGQMKTVDCELQRKNGECRWARVSFVPYMNDKGNLAYLVTVHRDISLLREAEVHIQQLYAMRTTLATIEHVVRNFLNSAQLYSSYVNTIASVDEAVQKPFDTALEEARLQIAAMKRMPSFKDKATSSGLPVLDVDR